MATKIPGLTVVGGAVDEVDACTMFVEDNQILMVGNVEVKCLLTPGHTKVNSKMAKQTTDAHLFHPTVLMVVSEGTHQLLLHVRRAATRLHWRCHVYWRVLALQTCCDCSSAVLIIISVRT